MPAFETRYTISDPPHPRGMFEDCNVSANLHSKYKGKKIMEISNLPEFYAVSLISGKAGCNFVQLQLNIPRIKNKSLLFC